MELLLPSIYWQCFTVLKICFYVHSQRSNSFNSVIINAFNEILMKIADGALVMLVIMLSNKLVFKFQKIVIDNV